VSSELTSTSQAVPRDADGRLAGDLACVQCGYNLRGLSPEGRCPECGCPVGRASWGTLLRYSDPDWVERLARGMRWVVGGIILTCLALALAGAMGFAELRGLPRVKVPESLATLPGVGLSVVFLVGYWLLTTPDPTTGQPEVGFSDRKGARGLLSVGSLLSILASAVGLAAPTAEQVISAVGEFLNIPGLFLLFSHLTELARRVPDPSLA